MKTNSNSTRPLAKGCKPIQCFLFTLFLTALCAGIATAQTLTNGADTAGVLVLNTTNTYTFSATNGDTILLRAGASNFTPRIVLIGPNGALLAASSSGNSADRGNEAGFRATNSGPFTVYFSSHFGGSGGYVLRLAKIPGALVVSPGETGGPLTNGWQHSGTIDVGDLDVWSFTASAGDSLVVKMGGTGFTPFVRLYGPDGVLLAANSSGNPADRTKEVDFRATNSGPFTVVASGWFFNNTGPYILTLGKSPGTITVAPGDTGGPLTNGWQHSGTIDVGDLDVWSFTASAGDSMVVKMGGTGFTPFVRLYGPDGALLAASSSGNPADRTKEVGFRATNSGPFTVMASGYFGGDTGPYILNLAKAPGSFLITPGDDGGLMTGAFAYTGTIDVGDLDMWSFTACAGDSIALTMTGTNLTPFLRLYGRDGALMAASSSSNPADRVKTISFVATNSGILSVVASGAFANNTGSYLLTVNGLSAGQKLCFHVHRHECQSERNRRFCRQQLRRFHGNECRRTIRVLDADSDQSI